MCLILHTKNNQFLITHKNYTQNNKNQIHNKNYKIYLFYNFIFLIKKTNFIILKNISYNTFLFE